MSSRYACRLRAMLGTNHDVAAMLNAKRRAGRTSAATSGGQNRLGARFVLDDRETSAGGGLERVAALLRQYWWIIVVCVVLVAGSATIFSVTRQKQYTATASLYFTQSQIGSDLLGVPVSSVSTDATTLQADDLEFVQSPEIAFMTSRALGHRLSVVEVQNAILATNEGQSDFVDIAATATSPSFAARLANLYAKQVIAFNASTAQAEISQVRHSLVLQLNAMSPAERSGSIGQTVSSRIDQLNTLAAAQSGDVLLTHSAASPSSPSYPKTGLNLAIGVVLGLLLGVGLALLLNRFNRRVRDVDELSSAFRLPVLAEVPDDVVFAVDTDGVPGDGLELVPFDMLRVRLRYLPSADQRNSVLVASSLPEEGKSTVAWHLACASAASAEGSVLLLEADLRRPSIAARHGLKPTPGLAGVLAGKAKVEAAIQEVAVAPGSNGTSPRRKLDVLVAGNTRGHVTSLIESERFRSLLDQLMESYDLVVIDSPPALLVPDALTLARQVGTVVIVSSVGSTTRDSIARLREQFDALDAPLAGIVANRVRETTTNSYGYYGPAATASA